MYNMKTRELKRLFFCKSDYISTAFNLMIQKSFVFLSVCPGEHSH